MQLRAILIDDEKKGISALKQLIEKYIKELSIIAESTSAQKGIELIEHYRPEIVFLDINMPEMNGFELLEKLTWKNFNLVFTTAHQEHGLRALKNNAIDYLLKPISREDLRLAVERVKKRLIEDKYTIEFNYKDLIDSMQEFKKQRLMIVTDGELEYVNVSEIIFLESKSNYTKICTEKSNELLTRKTLKEFEYQLCQPGSNFMRVHNSFIVNLDKTVRYSKDSECIVQNNNQKIPLAKSRKDGFFNWLMSGKNIPN